MKIGILSDTHKKIGRAIQVIDLFKKQKCKFIIHTGDIVKKEILDYLEDSDIPYIAVLGNNDKHLYEYTNTYNLVQEPYYFIKKNIKFKIMHRPYYLSIEDADIIVYGHTHTQTLEKTNKALFLNSGEVCARDKGYSQFIILDIKDTKYIIHKYNRKIKTKDWIISTDIFDK
jgi:putative phosphoesterase